MADFASMSFDARTGRVLAAKGSFDTKIQEGIGALLLVCVLLDGLRLGRLNLHDNVKIKDGAARDGKSLGAIGLDLGEKVDAHTLFRALICCNAPDAALALAEHVSGSRNAALAEMRDLGTKLGIRSKSLLNITGRKMSRRPQEAYMDDLYRGAKYLFSRPVPRAHLLNSTAVTYKGRTSYSSSRLLKDGLASQCFMFGESRCSGVALTHMGGKDVITVALAARDAFHRDYIMAETIASASAKVEPVPSVSTVPSPGPDIEIRDVPAPVKINVIGDTYFGEFYTERRRRRGVTDALMEYGYDHSFKKINSILAAGDYNIANFEAVLTSSQSSPLDGMKPFILGAQPKETVDSLKKSRVHAVTLGNNHAMDYGTEGLVSTMSTFSAAGIKTFGAGTGAVSAEEPLTVVTRNRKIIFYSGYWYRRRMHEQNGFYAMGNHPGVACLSGGLLDDIKEKRQRDPNAIIVMLAHWGTDFGIVGRHQRKYARQIINAGADLIIGHGAHTMQEISLVDNKWVVYSIGNGVFNSDGEYESRNVAPYSFIVQLRLCREEGNFLFLYPIYCDNLKTFWQPRPVDEEQFEEVARVQASFGTPIANEQLMQTGRDKNGFYIAVSI